MRRRAVDGEQQQQIAQLAVGVAKDLERRRHVWDHGLVLEDILRANRAREWPRWHGSSGAALEGLLDALAERHNGFYLLCLVLATRAGVARG